MTSVMKCMSLMTTAGFAAGAGVNYVLQNKLNKAIMHQVEATAKDGFIETGVSGKDGKMSVDDAKKQLNSHAKKASLIYGAMAAIGTAIISGITLLLRGKVKV